MTASNQTDGTGLAAAGTGLCYQHYGDESVLAWQALPAVVPRGGRLLIQVESVSVNPVDWKILAGEQRLFTGLRLARPRVFGSDFAGTVISAPGARLRPDLPGPGDRVCGFLNPLTGGSARDFLAVPPGSWVACPSWLEPGLAAALPVAGTTALRCLRLRPDAWWRGKSVYLNGAAGGIGHLLLQLLADRGARVTASARPDRHGELASLGAIRTIDYRLDVPISAIDRFDAIVDCHGGLASRRQDTLFSARGGLFVKVSLANRQIPGAILAMAGDRLAHGRDSRIMLAIPSRRLLAELVGLVAAGRLRPRIAARHGRGGAAQAVAQSRTGHAFGKIIIDLAPPG